MVSFLEDCHQEGSFSLGGFGNLLILRRLGHSTDVRESLGISYQHLIPMAAKCTPPTLSGGLRGCALSVPPSDSLVTLGTVLHLDRRKRCEIKTSSRFLTALEIMEE